MTQNAKHMNKTSTQNVITYFFILSPLRGV